MGNIHFSVKPTVAKVGLSGWNPPLIKAAIERLEDLQMKSSDSFGWTVERETCQAILQISENKVDQVWELCADGKEKCVVMNIIFGLIIFSGVKFRIKISMLFSLMRTRFEKILTSKQIDILVEIFANAVFTFFDITEKKKPVSNEQLLEAAYSLRETIEKRFGLGDITAEDLQEWIEDQEAVVLIFTVLGTTDGKKVLERLDDKWSEQ